MAANLERAEYLSEAKLPAFATLAAKNVFVRPSIVDDVYKLAANLRSGDRAEVEALGLDSRQGIRRSFRHAMLRRTYFVDGEIAAMTGVCGDMLGDIGFPYLMTAPPAGRVPIAFVKLARMALAEMLTHKLRLEGHVAANYAGACRLLETLGFTLGHPRPFGPTGGLFRTFHIMRAA